MNFVSTTLYIEFSELILKRYNGGLCNLDVTIDEEIWWFLQRPFNPNSIDLISMNRVPAKPNLNEDLYQLVIKISDSEKATLVQKIVNSLNEGKRCDGCTIKDASGAILYADIHTADIVERRRLQSKI